MLRFTLLTCLIAFAATSQVLAQQMEYPTSTGAKAEIGTLFGLTHSRGPEYCWFGDCDRSTETITGLPRVLSVWLIPSEMAAIGSEISFASVGTDVVSLLTGKMAFSPSYTSNPSIYVLGIGSLVKVSGVDAEVGAGIGMGLRTLIGSALVLRMEGRYERWFEGEINNFSLLLGFGTQLGG